MTSERKMDRAATLVGLGVEDGWWRWLGVAMVASAGIDVGWIGQEPQKYTPDHRNWAGQCDLV